MHFHRCLQTLHLYSTGKLGASRTCCMCLPVLHAWLYMAACNNICSCTWWAGFRCMSVFDVHHCGITESIKIVLCIPLHVSKWLPGHCTIYVYSFLFSFFHFYLCIVYFIFSFYLCILYFSCVWMKHHRSSTSYRSHSWGAFIWWSKQTEYPGQCFSSRCIVDVSGITMEAKCSKWTT